MKSLYTNPRVVSLLAGVALLTSVAVATPVAQASGLTQSQIGAVVNLLQSFGVDSATVMQVQNVLNGNTSTSTPSSNGPIGTATFPTNGNNGRGPSIEGLIHGGQHASACSAIARSLSVGSSGTAVTQLQQFLSKHPNIYPQGLVTGYFGRDTEEAVQRWQAMNNIVASGTPATTGYGVFGPRTREHLNKEMEKECNNGDQGSMATSSPETATGSSSDSNTGGDNSSATTTSSESNTGSATTTETSTSSSDSNTGDNSATTTATSTSSTGDN